MFLSHVYIHEANQPNNNYTETQVTGTGRGMALVPEQSLTHENSVVCILKGSEFL